LGESKRGLNPPRLFCRIASFCFLPHPILPRRGRGFIYKSSPPNLGESERGLNPPRLFCRIASFFFCPIPSFPGGEGDLSINHLPRFGGEQEGAKSATPFFAPSRPSFFAPSRPSPPGKVFSFSLSMKHLPRFLGETERGLKFTATFLPHRVLLFLPHPILPRRGRGFIYKSSPPIWGRARGG
jgi:hypothetical protein